MYKIGEEEVVLCPYNNYHLVSKLRIQRHIIKCQKNYPNIKLATCFYNYSHKLKPEDLLAHYETCPHKTRVEGARYSEPASRPSSAAKKDFFPQKDFPDINVKTQFFHDQSFFFAPKNDADSQQLGTSASETESEDSSFISKKPNAFRIPLPTRQRDCQTNNCNVQDDKKSKDKDYEDDDDNDDVDVDVDIDEFNNSYSDLEKDENDDDDDDDDGDELEPLPLPKTASKAFVYSKQQDITRKPSKPFGRGKSALVFSPPKESRTYDHLLPDLSKMDSNFPKRGKNSKFFLKKPLSSCSASVVSSVFDDLTTLKSEEVIFDDDVDDDDGFFLKNFDQYTKI